MKNFFRITLLFVLVLQFLHCTTQSTNPENEIIANKWQALQTKEEGGLLGDRIDLWRNHRLWNIAESGYLNDGFENRPGIHPWQGEHFGKWLHAATLAHNITGDEKLKNKMDEMVERLVATQSQSGYIGTYASHNTFMAVPENDMETALADDIQPTNKNANPAVSDKAPGG